MYPLNKSETNGLLQGSSKDFTAARLFEKILYGQVYEYFTSNKLLGNEQFGFRTLHSTALALSRSSSNWRLKIWTKDK